MSGTEIFLSVFRRNDDISEIFSVESAVLWIYHVPEVALEAPYSRVSGSSSGKSNLQTGQVLFCSSHGLRQSGW